jgi:mannan endo-1,4-beta-mannosidase
MRRANPGGSWPYQTGQDFLPNHLVDGIDFASVHMWPDNWDRVRVLLHASVHALGLPQQPITWHIQYMTSIECVLQNMHDVMMSISLGSVSMHA